MTPAVVAAPALDGAHTFDEPPDHREQQVQAASNEKIRPDQFMLGVVEQVLGVTPVTHHVRVRERYEGRTIPIEEGDTDVSPL